MKFYPSTVRLSFVILVAVFAMSCTGVEEVTAEAASEARLGRNLEGSPVSAIAAPEDAVRGGTDVDLGTGELSLNDGCLQFHTDDGRVLVPVWPAQEVGWDPGAAELAFSTGAEILQLAIGDRFALAGSGDPPSRTAPWVNEPDCDDLPQVGAWEVEVLENP